MAISQEGTFKEYCVSFQILFDQVKNREEISEIYGIYLFICGLEPEIREIFAEWHQYSCSKVKDVIALALKIDSNGLQDSFSPFDPTSSFYKKDLEFDLKEEENKAAFSVGVEDVDIIEESTKSDSQGISEEFEEETTVVVKPVVVEDISEDWLCDTKTKIRDLDQEHVVIDIAFENPKQESPGAEIWLQRH